MNWEALAAFGEVSGALAVVASLIFVGYQLRQGQSIERAKAQRDLLVQGREWMAIPGREEQNFEAIRSCLRDFDGASEFDKARFNGWAFDILLIMEQAFYMHRDGFLNDGSFYRFEQVLLSITRTRGGGQWWQLSYNVVGTDVGEYLTKRIDELGDSIPPYDELFPYMRTGDALGEVKNPPGGDGLT